MERAGRPGFFLAEHVASTFFGDDNGFPKPFCRTPPWQLTAAESQDAQASDQVPLLRVLTRNILASSAGTMKTKAVS
jgi:hypothetical protein